MPARAMRCQDIDGNLLADDAVCRAGRGERRLRTLPFCILKLRNFESMYRGNATGTLTWVDYIPADAIYNNVWRLVVFIITWRGLTALLILTWGQCEGLSIGMGEEVRISHAFFVSINICLTSRGRGSG